MGHVLRAGTQLEHRQNLRARIDDQPQPLHLHMAAQPGAQFVQLDVWEMQMAERVLMQHLRMLSRARQPPRDGGLTVAEDTLSCGSVQPFGQSRQHHGDLLRWRFQAIQRGVTPGSERGAAGLTTKPLDLLGTPMLAIADQCVLSSVCVAKVRAPPVGTSETLGVYAFGSSSAAFDLTPGTHRRWRWLRTRRGSGVETTGRAIVRAAWFKQTGERATLCPSR
jgi:hypothetical protein